MGHHLPSVIKRFSKNKVCKQLNLQSLAAQNQTPTLFGEKTIKHQKVRDDKH
jgi:hypothetical protein